MILFHKQCTFYLTIPFLLITSCSSIPMQNDISLMVSRTTQSSHIDYNVGPEDVLEVLVWKNEALSKVVIVRPDGKISLPLVGDVQAAGRSALQIKDDITQQLNPFYKEPPQVSVIVQQANSYVISILGEVQRPSQYVVKRDTTLLQAIALAGGFTPFASLNEIILLRRDNDNLKQLATQIRYKDIISGKYLDNNLFLQADDTIIVP